jgi:hypothetical protein
MKPAFQFDAYIQMLRCGSDGPFMRGNKAEYALLVHCTKMFQANEYLRNREHSLIAQLNANTASIKKWKRVSYVFGVALVVVLGYGLLIGG